MKKFLIGSTYFFKSIDSFKSKDIDYLILVEKPIGFKNVRQTTGRDSCLFEWRKMTADEFVEFALNSKCAMSAGKFLIPEINKEIGFTIEHLKKLAPVFDRIDEKHTYERIIFNAYIENNDFILTAGQLNAAYEEYLKTR